MTLVIAVQVRAVTPVRNKMSGSIDSGLRIAGEWPEYTIQKTIDAAAGSKLAVVIPSTYNGNDSFTNPENIPILDLRPMSAGGTGFGGLLASMANFSAIDGGTF